MRRLPRSTLSPYTRSSDRTSFGFTVSNVSHGSFQILVNGDWVDTTTFASTDLAVGHVRFHDDGSDFTPTFSVKVNDGTAVNAESAVFDGAVQFTEIVKPPPVTFATQTSYFTLSSPLSVAIGDLNSDGAPDIVVANYLSPALSVWFGKGDGTFRSPTTFVAG